MSCGVGRRCGLDLALLWLLHRPAAIALIRLLAWELSCAMVVALKSKDKTKQNKTKTKTPKPKTNQTNKKPKKKTKQTKPMTNT